MLIFFDTVVSLVISFFMLRKSGTPKRHALAFFTNAVLSGIISFATFEVVHPYGGVSTGARYSATLDSQVAWVIGMIAGFVLGALAAKMLRPKTQSASA